MAGAQAPVAMVALVTLFRGQLGHSRGPWVLKLEVHELLHRMLTLQEPLGSNFLSQRGAILSGLAGN